MLKKRNEKENKKKIKRHCSWVSKKNVPRGIRDWQDNQEIAPRVQLETAPMVPASSDTYLVFCRTGQ
jgi:hypothetical protein